MLRERRPVAARFVVVPGPLDVAQQVRQAFLLPGAGDRVVGRRLPGCPGLASLALARPLAGARREVLPDQIVVMVGIAARSVSALPADTSSFPAVLETGNNHNFAIRHDPLNRWTGVSLPKRGLVIVGGGTIPLDAANVGIHPDLGGPSRLRMEEGIVVYPPDVANPARLPIPGLRGLVRNGLTLPIDGKAKDVTVGSS